MGHIASSHEGELKKRNSKKRLLLQIISSYVNRDFFLSTDSFCMANSFVLPFSRVGTVVLAEVFHGSKAKKQADSYLEG